MADEKKVEDAYERAEITCRIEEENQSTTGWVLRRNFSQGERIARASKVAGILFGAAVLTVFIPILHFVLVPLFLLLTVIFGVSVFLEKGEVLKGEVPCPQCKKTVSLTKEAESWPKSMRCANCSYPLKIQL